MKTVRLWLTLTSLAYVMCVLSNGAAGGQSTAGSMNRETGSRANRQQVGAGMAFPPNTGATAVGENTANTTAAPCRHGSSTNKQTPCTTSSPAAANRATGTQAGAASAPPQESRGSAASRWQGSVPADRQPDTPQSNWSASYQVGPSPDLAQNSSVPKTCPGQGAEQSKGLSYTGSSNQIRCRSTRIQIDSFLLRDLAP